MRRFLVLLTMAVTLTATFAAPAGATKPSIDGEHKVTICHATRSLSNPYVVITIDEAAWEGDGPRAHGTNHDREKDGFEWTDHLLSDGQGIEDCPGRTGPPPPPDPGSCTDADYVVTFGDTRLLSDLYTSPVLRTSSVTGFAIPPGDYLVTLGSSDSISHPDGSDSPQVNEQWRADFGPGVYSSYSDDLPEELQSSETILEGTVHFDTTVTVIWAEHWDFAQESLSIDSIVPDCVALMRIGTE